MMLSCKAAIAYCSVVASCYVLLLLTQYPGVASSINSDIDNLMGVMRVWNIFPEGTVVVNQQRLHSSRIYNVHVALRSFSVQ